MPRTPFLAIPLAGCLALPAGAQLSNQDDCASSGADVVGAGVHAFDNSAATTGSQGQNEIICYQFGSTAITNDIWFTYVASANGPVVIDTCAGGGNRDTRLAAWPGAPACPADGTALVCDDDTCGEYSRISFVATAGTAYIVQVGNFVTFPGGTGAVTITESEPPGIGCVLDRASFTAAVGTLGASEDFSGFAVDTSFEAPAAVNLATGTITAVNPTGFRNFVDTPPFLFSDNGGTNHASSYTNRDEPVEVQLAFTAPASGYGADLYQAADLEGVELVALGCGGRALAVCAAGNGAPQFLGYVGGQPLEGVVYRSSTLVPGPGGEGFGLDDLVVGAPQGTSYCAANPSSTGLPGVMLGTGTTSAAANDFVLNAACLPPEETGYFIAAAVQGLRFPAASSGIVCFDLFAGIGRYSSALASSGPAGVISTPVDWTAVPTADPPSFTTTLMAGDTHYFQCWFRDGATNNFTDGLCVTLTP